MTLADRIMNFNRQLSYTGKKLPAGIRVMNPFLENEQTLKIANQFYQKYYNDTRPRYMLLGINPGRFGTGVTGIPFTDPKRLVSDCGIPYEGKLTHEPSSVFIYDMIHAYGGPEAFYGRFYIHSICPLGFTNTDARGREKNYNYYDSPALLEAVHDFIIGNLFKQLAFGIHKNVGICLGTGKNSAVFQKLNDEHNFFKRIIALEHPRFIVQYKSSQKQFYIDKYLALLSDPGKV